jgi:hypothetical protein
MGEGTKLCRKKPTQKGCPEPLHKEKPDRREGRNHNETIIEM